MSEIAKTPEPPYFAVIFTSTVLYLIEENNPEPVLIRKLR